MVGLVKLIGSSILAVGIIFLLKPGQIKKWLHFWMAENHIYLGGLLNVLIGIIFLIAAPRCDIPWVVVIFGILSLTKGIVIFVSGRQRVSSFVDKQLKKPNKALRRWGILASLFGILLIWAA